MKLNPISVIIGVAGIALMYSVYSKQQQDIAAGLALPPVPNLVPTAQQQTIASSSISVSDESESKLVALFNPSQIENVSPIKPAVTFSGSPVEVAPTTIITAAPVVLTSNPVSIPVATLPNMQPQPIPVSIPVATLPDVQPQPIDVQPERDTDNSRLLEQLYREY